MSELNARKYGLYEKFHVAEFMKPDVFYAKKILADHVCMIHALHEIKLVDLVDVIYNISLKLREGGSFHIIEQRELLEKERKFCVMG